MHVRPRAGAAAKGQIPPSVRHAVALHL